MNVKTNPLNERQLAALGQLAEELTSDQILWLSGYLEGILAATEINGSKKTPVAVSVPETSTKLTILYGTDTGRSKSIAEKLAEKAASLQITASVVNMYDYKTRQLKDEENLAVIVSTHGEGEPPDMAEDFHKYVTGKRAPKLASLKYSVLALGDKSYKYFCKTGEDIDAAFTKLGAASITPIIKCDVDYEDEAEKWMNLFLQNLATSTPVKVNSKETITEAKTAYSKKNPFMATVLEKVKITGRGSDKEVYHLELSLEDSGLTYEPGDSIGILPKNPTSLVQQILQKTGIDALEKVQLKENEITFEEALSHHLEITLLNRDVLQKYAEKSGNAELKKLLNDDQQLDDFLYGSDLLDLLEDFPYKWTAQDLTEILRPLPARLYSISSSQELVGEEVHATVSVVRYNQKNRQRLGACSSFLADNIEVDDQVPVYIEKNPAFKLPANGARIIMVGAGTGIAPYRAFMQHRESQGLQGNSWLFFGDRRFHSDFLYQKEWQKLLKAKQLERMEVAFSRDQKDKIYVQHKLKEHQKEIYEWLENGAHFYLCGDMKNMAKDVNKTLLEIIRVQGGVSEEQAEKYVKQLKREKRFQADVY